MNEMVMILRENTLLYIYCYFFLYFFYLSVTMQFLIPQFLPDSYF